MKQYIYLIIFIVALLIAAIFYGRSTVKQQVIFDSSKLEALQDSIKIMEERGRIWALLDSTKSLEIKKLRSQIPPTNTQQIAQIDSSISKDSINAVLEARKQLIDLNVQKITLSLNPFTNYEYGQTAKLLSSIKPMGLRINWLRKLDSLNTQDLEIKDKRISELTYLRKADSDAKQLLQNSSDFWQGEYEKTKSFFFNRFNVSLSVFGGYSNQGLVSGLGLSIGISIWKSE